MLVCFCVHVCVCVCVDVCVVECVCVDEYVCVNVCVCMLIRACVYIHIYIYIYVRACVCVCMYVCVYVFLTSSISPISAVRNKTVPPSLASISIFSAATTSICSPVNKAPALVLKRMFSEVSSMCSFISSVVSFDAISTEPNSEDACNLCVYVCVCVCVGGCVFVYVCMCM